LDQEFGKTVLQQRAEALLSEIASLADRASEKAIHDTRVQSRRMRAALEAFQDLFAPHPWRALYDSVRGITKILGGPRETGVMLGLVRDLGGSGDLAESLCREFLAEKTRRKLRRQERRLQRKLKTIDPPRLHSQVDFLMSGMEPQEISDAAPSSRPIPSAARGRRRAGQAAARPTLPRRQANPDGRAQRIFAESAQPILSFRPRYDFRRATDEQLHALRITAKKLRYAMEIFDPVWPGGLKEPIAQSRALQDAGGNYHDWCVLCESLKAEIRRLNQRETAHLAFQIGRLLACAEDRRTELRKQILPALTTLQATLGSLLAQAAPEPRRKPPVNMMAGSSK
jgi:CHAD domain-containing protein